MNFNNQKRNFERYLGTRKYKLSFWGFNPHVDWMILISYVLIGFVCVVFYAVLEFKEVEKELSVEVVTEIKKEKFNYKKVNELFDEYFGVVEELNESEQNPKRVDQTE